MLKAKSYLKDNNTAITFFSKNPEFSYLNDFKYTVLPGFCDVHVHFREPGFSYKETIETGSKASARGGYTSVCTMPNLKPVPDSKENLQIQLDLIKNNAVISVYPYASITKGEKGETLSNMDELKDDAIAFSDDGRGVQTKEMMLKAMLKAKSLNKMIVAHCEVDELLKGGYIHDGEYARKNGHKGICSESEWKQVERDIELVKETGVKYHVCHISTKESVALIRKAKAQGLQVTCETAPHYLVFDDTDLIDNGAFKMNPPIRSNEDKLALIEGVLDGTIDLIATDHAPHSKEEKEKGLAGSNFGVVGIETAFSVMYTHFVKTNKMSMEKLLDLLVYNAEKIFGIKPQGFSVWELDKEFIVNPDEFLSQGKYTPFTNCKLNAVNNLTVYNDKPVYQLKK